MKYINNGLFLATPSRSMSKIRKSFEVWLGDPATKRKLGAGSPGENLKKYIYYSSITKLVNFTRQLKYSCITIKSSTKTI